ncbi:glycosyltransferase family 61 protein [Bacillus sp. EB01]|uniref:glycosyltransferase family 61 protein n=1 Tax=Bacillus sp. EB01 TaxID=1347086 RepID=UPI000693F115|nr:glycosyltransferase family 61 protein [Bacillus sp. EB01]
MEQLLPPIGIYNSLKDWFSYTDPNESEYHQIYPATSFKRTIKHPPSRYPIVLEGGDIGIIPHGGIWGLNGAIITANNHLIWDVSKEMVETPYKHSIFKQKSLPPVSHYYKSAADLTHVFSENYYHWLYEVLPRIHLLEQRGIKPEYYICKYNALPFQSETLSQLGFLEKIVITNHDTHLQAEELIVPSQPSYATKWGFDFLRRSFLKENSLKPSKRIYIRRKGYRRITNQGDIDELLFKYKFLQVELETLSFFEQVQLFSSAEIIIAAHGAGLANLTFCTPGTQVLEIFSPTYITPLYWTISNFGNLNYHYYIGQLSEQDKYKSDQGWHGTDNIVINLSKLSSFLKKLRL